MTEEARLQIETAVAAELVVLAEAAAPLECCGALIGRADPSVVTVTALVPLANDAAGDRTRRFSIGAAAVRDTERRAHDAGLELVGFYHSHPGHPPEPSSSDLAHAWPWYTYVIASVGIEVARPVRAWRLRDDRTAFDELAIVDAADR